MSAGNSMKAPIKVICWGTYDLGKPRNRILLRGLRENGVEVYECHKDIWCGVEDKSQLRGVWVKVRFLLRWLISYPGLIYRYMKAPPHDLVFVAYLGQFDVLVLALFARLRGVPVVWDVFLSLYDTVVNDRKMLHSRNPLSWFLYAWEWIAARSVSAILMDTKSHADYFKELYNLNNKMVGSVFVGTEPEHFRKMSDTCENLFSVSENYFSVLFYGQFIPLHGVETIVKAARLLREEKIEWVIIGQGQEAGKIEKMLTDDPMPKINWIRWVEYGDLVDWIHDSNLCLGIFGVSGKASRVIPNKLFQVIAAGKPIVTQDSSAIRELLDPDMENVFFVPSGDPQKLAEIILNISRKNNLSKAEYPKSVTDQIYPVTIGYRLVEFFQQVIRV
jgi:glycosyltransferase involved in cell wall biosynthesis